MTESPTRAELADRYSRRRARMMPVLAVLFLTQQVSYFAGNDASRTVDHVKIGAWLLMAAVILAILMTGGAWLRPAAVRALMNDDITRANRDRAVSLGFVVSMATAMALYPFAALTGVSAQEAIHVIVSLGLIAALIRFGALERRALA